MASGNARMLQDSEDAPPPCKRSRVPKQHGPKREPQSASEGAFLSRGVEDEQGEAGMLPCGGDGLRHRETSNEGEPARSLLPTEGAVQRENSALASSRVVDTADRTTVRPNGHTGQEARPLERDGFRIETICIDSNCDCVAEYVTLLMHAKVSRHPSASRLADALDVAATEVSRGRVAFLGHFVENTVIALWICKFY